MSEPYLAEIRLFSFGFVPKDWAPCDGRLLPISRHTALFSILGFTYGGDGATTFALPDLRGRVPVHAGGGISRGAQGGEEYHTLIVRELPAHTHQAYASDEPASMAALNGFWAADGSYAASVAGPVSMGSDAIATAGGSQPHENRQPFLTLNFCIALQGIFPSPD
jgi:microcystin-dependent protein